MGSQAFGLGSYATGSTMSQTSGSTSPSDNLSLNTAQRSNYTPETMSFGHSYDSPISPETPRLEGPGHRRMSGFPDESANALLFENMDRRPSFAASHSSFEVSPTKSTGDHMYTRTEGIDGVNQNNLNPSAAYPVYAMQPNFSRHQAPWYIENGTQLNTSRGIFGPGLNNLLSQHCWTGHPQVHASPPGNFDPIEPPRQFHQPMNFNEYQHPQDTPQLPQAGFGVFDDTPDPPVSCSMCNTQFTGKYAKGNRKRHLARHNPLVVAVKTACRVCEKVYKRADAARKHEWDKHKIPDTKPKKRV